MKKPPRPTTVDFETDGIEGRPDYPPAPIGVSIKKWGKKARYYAFHHTEDNNCTWDQAVAAVREAYANPDGVLFQNAKFDIDVAEVHFKLTPPAWDKIHDTLFLIFLDDPHARALDLKGAAKRLLGIEPEERDAVADWLVKNQPLKAVQGIRITRAKNSFMKYLRYAPGASVVGPYANGDVDRTEGLFRLLYPRTIERKMIAAYDRERELMPILLDMERQGVRVDLKRLRADVALYQKTADRLEAWTLKRLVITDPKFNLGSDDQLLEALKERDLVDVEKMGVTEKEGRVKMDKDALAAGVRDPVLAGVLRYSAQLHTCLVTFLKPWLLVAERSGGLIFTNWRQTRQPGGGARTGRMSSSPNWQNIPKEFQPIFHHEGIAAEWKLSPDKRDALKKLPACPIKDLPPLPLCRGYVVPYAPGHVIAGRDYSQQEPRMLAHFEADVEGGGALLEQYLADPWIDYHDNARDHLERVFQRKYDRKPVKNINLGIIYGEGVAALALKNGSTYSETKELKDAIYSMYPGLKQLYREMRRRAEMEEPIRTWGGREYYCEPPAIIKGRIVKFDYKMVNVLIQGSAADCTKEAMIRYYKIKPKNHFLLIQVHDELIFSCPADELVMGLALLQQAMESVEFDLPILSDGEWSRVSWEAMKTYDKKGKVVANDDLPRQKRPRKAA